MKKKSESFPSFVEFIIIIFRKGFQQETRTCTGAKNNLPMRNVHILTYLL